MDYDDYRKHLRCDVKLLVTRDGTNLNIKIVDFDWARKVGEARYPMNVFDRPALWGPEDVRDGQLITSDQILNHIFDTSANKEGLGATLSWWDCCG